MLKAICLSKRPPTPRSPRHQYIGSFQGYLSSGNLKSMRFLTSWAKNLAIRRDPIWLCRRWGCCGEVAR